MANPVMPPFDGDFVPFPRTPLKEPSASFHPENTVSETSRVTSVSNYPTLNLRGLSGHVEIMTSDQFLTKHHHLKSHGTHHT